MKRLGYFLAACVIAAVVIFLPSSVYAATIWTGRIDAIDTVATVFPANGDLNAHGIAFIPASVGVLKAGNFLVSHFNNAQNIPGKGTTIVQVSPNGDTQLFARIDPAVLAGKCDEGVGLTALVVAKSGWVIAGNLPTSNGSLDTARPGCLIVLNSQGQVVETISNNLIKGPWGLALSEGTFYDSLFVSNVLNSTQTRAPAAAYQGNIVRINFTVMANQLPRVLTSTVIGSGFTEQADLKGFILGPSGLGFAPNGNLYIADTLSNRIAVIPDAAIRVTNAGEGNTIIKDGAILFPTGLALTPNGHILVVNGGDGNLVEVTPRGSQVAVKRIDTIGTGDHTLFGVVIRRDGVYFLNDGDDALNILH